VQLLAAVESALKICVAAFCSCGSQFVFLTVVVFPGVAVAIAIAVAVAVAVAVGAWWCGICSAERQLTAVSDLIALTPFI